MVEYSLKEVFIGEVMFELYNMDCIEKLRSLENESIDLIVTDPPYNLGNFMKNRQVGIKRMRDNFFAHAGWDDFEYEEWVENMDLFLQHSNRILKKKGALVVFMSLIKIETLVKLAEKHNLYYKTTGVWHKLNPMPRNMNLHFVNSIEGWVYFVSKGKTGTFNNCDKVLHDFVESGITPKREKRCGAHPTQKPEKIISHFVETLSNPNEIVLDPFMGSGTTGVAAIRNNRKFIGIELSEEYYKISKERIEEVLEEESAI